MGQWEKGNGQWEKGMGQWVLDNWEEFLIRASEFPSMWCHPCIRVPIRVVHNGL